MKVPVIILNYNSFSDCQKCIGFLKKQQGISLEIVVVDNCSPKAGEQAALKEFCSINECTFIQAEQNRGYNAGNNIGLRYAAAKGYKYALIANPDMEFPQTNYIAKLVKKMEEDEEIVVCGSDIVGPNGDHQSPMQRDGDWKSSWNWLFDLKKRNKSGNTTEAYHYSHYCSKIGGCCLMVSVSFIKSINFFDEYPFLYCEEAILSRQVENFKKRMYYISNIQALHRHIPSTKGDPVKRFYHWRRSRLYFIKKYSGDSFIGKMLAALSFQIYVSSYILKKKLKC